MIKRLPDNSSTLYSDLLQKIEDSPFVTLSGGAFVSKEIQGTRYWYYQTRSLGKQVQKYLGKESAQLLTLIGEAKSAREKAGAILDERRRLVAMLLASGAAPEKGRPAKVLAKLSDAGLFSGGGALVGSFAFACYGNMLGVSPKASLSRTEDMDFSVERGLEIGLSRNLQKDISEIEPDLGAPRQINPWLPPFEMKTPDGFKIEFLTTKCGIHDKAPVLIERFGIHAQPLDHMDYLLDGTQLAVVLNGAGIPVKVPELARFALYKLAVSQLRPPGHQGKTAKDIAQAGCLIEILSEDNSGALLLALEAASARDDGMPELVRKGAKRLPESAGTLLDLIGCLPN